MNWRRWLRRDDREASLERELSFHIEGRVADMVRSGVSEEDARRKVRLEFGAAEQVKDECRDVRPARWAETFVQDVRYALRSLGRNSGFAAVGVATLALGIGGVTAMFSVFDAVLIRRLPYPDADRLVMIWDDLPEVRKIGGPSKSSPTPAEWLEWRYYNSVFTDIASSQPGTATLSGDSAPEQVQARKVTGNLWNVLAARPLIGRVFTEEEDQKKVRVVVISYGLWQRRYGGSPDVLGRKITINDNPYEVIGVMPREFYFLPARDIDIWIPASFAPWILKSFGWHDEHVVARLKPGMTLERASESMAALSLRVTAAKDVRPHSVIVTPLREDLTGKTRRALVLLLSASATLLLIACGASRIRRRSRAGTRRTSDAISGNACAGDNGRRAAHPGLAGPGFFGRRSPCRNIDLWPCACTAGIAPHPTGCVAPRRARHSGQTPPMVPTFAHRP
jgi:putative ABC transport system permease protein